MTMNVSPLGLRLFLEGIEVPVISAQVNITPNQPAAASIQVVPSDMGLHLLPRTLVHLFYLDNTEELPYKKQRPGQAPDDDLNRFDALDTQYKNCFAGEIIGLNYGKNPSQRQLILQCMDLSTYWDTCYQWFADYSVGGNGLTDKSASFMGAGKYMFNSVAGGHQWVIGRLINSKPKSTAYRDAEGLLAGLLHVLEAIGGIKYKSDGEPGFNGVNDFFTIAELRYNLLGMIGAVAADKTSARMYANKAFRHWLRNGMTSMGNLLSFRDILNHICRHIFHNIYPNPTPYYVSGGTEFRGVTVDSTIYVDSSSGLLVKIKAKKAYVSLSKIVYHNLSIPSGTEGARIVGVAEAYRRTKNAQDNLSSAFELAKTLKTDDSSSVEEAIGEAKFFVDDALRLFDEIGFDRGNESDPDATDITIGDINNVARQLDGFVKDAQGILKDKFLSPAYRAKKQTLVETTSVEGAHLYTQLVLPELFFVPPPRCNVFFPDQLFQFNYSRNFMREITRLNCQSGLGMLAGGRRGAQLFARSYFSPSIKDSDGNVLYSTMSRGSRVLLPHEVHSGIIPKFERVPDGHRWAVKASKETGKNLTPSDRVGYLQRLANFQFYLHRWSSRTISFSGVFNPYPVVGFPALILDRSMPSPEVVKSIEKNLGRRWLPLQYVGKLSTLTHSINQQGGQTAGTLTLVRTHRGFDDEFLAMVEKTEKRQTTVKFESRSVAYMYDPKTATGWQTQRTLKNRDEYAALIKQWSEGRLHERIIMKTGKYRGTRIRKLRTSGGYITLEGPQARRIGISVEDADQSIMKRDEAAGGTTFVERDVSDNYAEMGGGAVNVPKTFEITFEWVAGTGEFERQDIAIEDALTPGWYSPEVWGKDHITEKVYEPLLGTSAITDDIALKQSEQDQVIDREFKEEFAIQLTEVDGDETTTTVRSKESVPGSITKLEIVPGSIEEAIDSITVLYGLLKNRGADMHEFIKEYTKRDIANIEQILGSQNLEFDDNGNVDPDLPADVVEGFHSRAFGDYNVEVERPTREGAGYQAGKDALKGLFPGVANGATVARRNVIDRGREKTSIRPELDPRGRARARVRGYLEELMISRGLMG